jgi:hypothetical protein
MKNVLIFSVVVLAIMSMGFAKKTYKYVCPKCKLVQEYENIGTKKCPNDGRTMIRK